MVTVGGLPRDRDDGSGPGCRRAVAIAAKTAARYPWTRRGHAAWDTRAAPRKPRSHVRRSSASGTGAAFPPARGLRTTPATRSWDAGPGVGQGVSAPQS